MDARGLILWVLCWGLPSCGDRSNSSTSLTPMAEFEPLEEERAAYRSCAEEASGGCGTVFASGSAVKGAFVFDSLFVKCEALDEGFRVSMRNSLSDSATFLLGFSIKGVSRGSYLCTGIELDEESGDVADGTCELAVRVHRGIFAASPQSRCVVRFSGATPPSGTLSCDGLLAGAGTLAISERSTFSCVP